MAGFRFSNYVPGEDKTKKSDFDKLFDIFKELLTMASGDVAETLSWMSDLDRQYNITSKDYGMGQFIEDLKDKGYIKEEGPGNPNLIPTAKTNRTIRERSLDEIFGKLKRGNAGNHKTNFSGKGDEITSDFRDYQFGDATENIAMTESIRNAQINNGLGDFDLTERDLMVMESEFKTQTSTVLMIDISHSMILYGEDRITPAKKTAMALAELITKKYPKDTLDIIVFGNDAWRIEVKDLPFLSVGPYHTNTVAGLDLAMDILRRQKNRNKQIFMITDGKPTCLHENGGYYKNSFGLDRKIINKTLSIAASAKRLKIPITTFMIATDPYLKEFVQEFTEVNQGRAYYSSLKGLGEFIFEDYQKNRKKSVR